VLVAVPENEPLVVLKDKPFGADAEVAKFVAKYRVYEPGAQLEVTVLVGFAESYASDADALSAAPVVAVILVRVSVFVMVHD
jgi:hypothetical protein